jgi:tetratricopeptide (TPR) repeat protein
MVRKRFPNRPLAYVQGAGCLRHLGRLAPADALIRSAMKLMPDDVPVRLEYGRLGVAGGDWAEAYRRWEEISDRHPAGLTGMAEALHQQGKDAEAEALIESSRLKWPLEVDLRALYARIAADGGRIDEAVQRWAAVRERFPRDQIGYSEGLALLRGHQRWEEADAVAAAAVSQFPDRIWTYVEHAMLAHQRQDWPEAQRRWAALREAFPDDPTGYRRGIEALEAAGTPAEAEPLRAALRDRFAA